MVYSSAGNVGLTRFLMKHPERSGNQKKKDPLRGSFFSYRPSAGAVPRSVPTQQTEYVVAPTLQLLTISLAKPFLSNTCRRGMASLQSNSTFSNTTLMRLDTWVSYDVAYGQPLPWRCARRRLTSMLARYGMEGWTIDRYDERGKVC